LLPLYPP